MVTETLTRPEGTKAPKPRKVPRARGPQRVTRIKDTAVDRVFMVGVYILLSIFLLVVLIPLIYIVSSSFSDPTAVSSGRVFLWPVDFTLEG